MVESLDGLQGIGRVSGRDFLTALARQQVVRVQHWTGSPVLSERKLAAADYMAGNVATVAPARDRMTAEDAGW